MVPNSYSFVVERNMGTRMLSLHSYVYSGKRSRG